MGCCSSVINEENTIFNDFFNSFKIKKVKPSIYFSKLKELKNNNKLSYFHSEEELLKFLLTFCCCENNEEFNNISKTLFNKWTIKNFSRHLETKFLISSLIFLCDNSDLEAIKKYFIESLNLLFFDKIVNKQIDIDILRWILTSLVEFVSEFPLVAFSESNKVLNKEKILLSHSKNFSEQNRKKFVDNLLLDDQDFVDLELFLKSNCLLLTNHEQIRNKLENI